MTKPIDLAAIGQAIIAQTKQIEECFQNSQQILRSSGQENNIDVDNFSTSIHTLNRLVSQLTVSLNLLIYNIYIKFLQMKIAERDHERDLHLKEIRKLKDLSLK